MATQDITRWHTETITAPCEEALTLLAKVGPMRDFYLAGGTALALQLGHRISVDLDFFSDNNHLGQSERRKIITCLSPKTIRVIEEKDETLHATVNGVHSSFFYFAPKLLEKPKALFGIQMASMMDIGTMKLSAVAGRGSRKDFIDLYFITKDMIPLRALLQSAQKKFRESADFTAQALRALIYFRDAELESSPKMLRTISWKSIKEHFEKEVRAISRDFLNT